MAESTKNPAPVVSKEEAAQMKAVLPEAGFAREEELAKRKDALQEAIETQTADTYTIDPTRMVTDREIAYHINRNELEVTEAQEGRRYCWVYTGQVGKEIMAKKKDGWIPVSGQDPEAMELKAVDGTRRLGDVMLMWISEKQYHILEAVDKYRRIRQQEGIVGNIRELADQTKGAVILHESGGMIDVAAKRAAMQQQAMYGVDRMLREGTVPGLPTYPK